MNSIFIFKFKFEKHLIFLHEKLKINWIELKSKSFWRKKNKTIRLFEICLYATFRKNLRKWKTKYLYTTLTKKSDIKLLSSKDFFFWIDVDYKSLSKRINQIKQKPKQTWRFEALSWIWWHWHCPIRCNIDRILPFKMHYLFFFFYFSFFSLINSLFN